jgi:hypothetical protein
MVSGTLLDSLRKDAIREVGVRRSSRLSSSDISCTGAGIEPVQACSCVCGTRPARGQPTEVAWGPETTARARNYLIEGLLVRGIRLGRKDDMARVNIADFDVVLHGNFVDRLALTGSNAEGLACWNAQGKYTSKISCVSCCRNSLGPARAPPAIRWCSSSPPPPRPLFWSLPLRTTQLRQCSPLARGDLGNKNRRLGDGALLVLDLWPLNLRNACCMDPRAALKAVGHISARAAAESLSPDKGRRCMVYTSACRPPRPSCSTRPAPFGAVRPAERCQGLTCVVREGDVDNLRGHVRHRRHGPQEDRRYGHPSCSTSSRHSGHALQSSTDPPGCHGFVFFNTFFATNLFMARKHFCRESPSLYIKARPMEGHYRVPSLFS